MTNEEYQLAMQEYLTNGGTVQQIARGIQSETATTNFWGAKKEKKVEGVLSDGSIDA
jgi:transposase-like protein